MLSVVNTCVAFGVGWVGGQVFLKEGIEVGALIVVSLDRMPVYDSIG